MNTHNIFHSVSGWCAAAMGHPYAFLLAAGGVAVWAAAGPVFGFSDTWQLTINTGTTIITFLMVFLVQHTQNRQGDAVQLKLDELIRAIHGAHNYLINLENAPDDELRTLKEQYRRLRDLAEQQRAPGEGPDGRASRAEG